MKHIAILGFGIVGSGVARVLEQNAARIARTVGDEVDINISSICGIFRIPPMPIA